METIRDSIIVGVFECINWVDMLVRNVVLRGILLEISTDAANFKVPAAVHKGMNVVGKVLDPDVFKELLFHKDRWRETA